MIKWSEVCIEYLVTEIFVERKGVICIVFKFFGIMICCFFSFLFNFKIYILLISNLIVNILD